MIQSTATLEMLMKVYNLMSDTDREAADKVISGEWYKNEPYKINQPTYQNVGQMDIFIPFLIGEMIRALKADIVQSENGRKKPSGKKSIINKLLKKNVTENAKEAMRYTFVKDGRQIVANGVQVYSFSEVDEQFPICPDNLKDSYLKYEPIMDKARETCTQELELPSAKLLAEYIKQNRNNYYDKKVPYCFGINLPVMDADVLLNALKALPTMRLHWDGVITTHDKSNYEKVKYILNPLYAIDKEGNEAILLPIKAGDNYHAGQEKTQL